MGRLRDAAVQPAPAAVADGAGLRSRGDVLSDAAYSHRRVADGLIEQELGRVRAMAGLAGTGGVLAFVLGVLATMELVQPLLLMGLAGMALLVPTGWALVQATATTNRLVDASYERGFCQALAVTAKRLGDSIGATDLRNVLLGPEAIINGQIDSLYKDLDRAKQRLEAAGGGADLRSAANRMHERIVPAQTETVLMASDGRRYPARIVDVSQSGVALKGAFGRFHDGEEVLAGARRARVVKVAPGQVALAFLTPILPSELNKRIVL